MLGLCGVISCGKGSNSLSEEEIDERFFNNRGVVKRVPIIEFKIKPDPDNDPDAKKVGEYTITNKDELKALYHTLCNPNTYFLELNVPAVDRFLRYDCTFADNKTLHNQVTLRFNKDRTYMCMYFPDDTGWMGGRYRYIRLDGVLSEKTVKELRDKFLPKGSEPPIFDDKKQQEIMKKEKENR